MPPPIRQQPVTHPQGQRLTRNKRGSNLETRLVARCGQEAGDAFYNLKVALAGAEPDDSVSALLTVPT